ncbi:hypothetical protein [Falsarthrobacter nasiphocae]|uniref:Uncharacterized protein n=1 Tax=Falsarthrobacter nasiphocae TaxID=189863 RepID=A0AAE3YE20_9MICC|nr:hypothetical protein [Falsarthrobacter nasiphocae]MDR6892143.1 hypothetical protein [Falsarthrobacter nasiphocae]
MTEEPLRVQTPWYKRDAVKIPLLFATCAGAVAGWVSMLAMTGGSDHPLRVDVGAIGFGIAFIASLVVAAMLQMVEKPNDPELGQGSGINRRSADIPGGAMNVPDPRKPQASRPAADDDAAAAQHPAGSEDAAAEAAAAAGHPSAAEPEDLERGGSSRA